MATDKLQQIRFIPPVGSVGGGIDDTDPTDRRLGIFRNLSPMTLLQNLRPHYRLLALVHHGYCRPWRALVMIYLKKSEVRYESCLAVRRQLAVTCGFKSLQHFARVFGWVCGISPSEYCQESLR